MKYQLLSNIGKEIENIIIDESSKSIFMEVMEWDNQDWNRWTKKIPDKIQLKISADEWLEYFMKFNNLNTKEEAIYKLINIYRAYNHNNKDIFEELK